MGDELFNSDGHRTEEQKDRCEEADSCFLQFYEGAQNEKNKQAYISLFLL
jgi:hypothetical protein